MTRSPYVAFSRIPRSIACGMFADTDTVVFDRSSGIGRRVAVVRNVVYPGLVVS